MTYTIIKQIVMCLILEKDSVKTIAYTDIIVYKMEESKKKLICIGIMILCLSWVAGAISNSLSVAVIFACFCIAYLIYQSLNKEDGE